MTFKKLIIATAKKYDKQPPELKILYALFLVILLICNKFLELVQHIAAGSQNLLQQIGQKVRLNRKQARSYLKLPHQKKSSKKNIFYLRTINRKI